PLLDPLRGLEGSFRPLPWDGDRVSVRLVARLVEDTQPDELHATVLENIQQERAGSSVGLQWVHPVVAILEVIDVGHVGAENGVVAQVVVHTDLAHADRRTGRGARDRHPYVSRARFGEQLHRTT